MDNINNPHNVTTSSAFHSRYHSWTLGLSLLLYCCHHMHYITNNINNVRTISAIQNPTSGLRLIFVGLLLQPTHNWPDGVSQKGDDGLNDLTISNLLLYGFNKTPASSITAHIGSKISKNSKQYFGESSTSNSGACQGSNILCIICSSFCDYQWKGSRFVDFSNS